MSTQILTPQLIRSDLFTDVAAALNEAAELAGTANAALDKGVAGVDFLATALTDIDTFMSVLKDLDEAVTITEDVLTAASSLLEELGVGEVFDAIATALKAVQDAYKGPLKELEKLDAETVQKIAPTINQLRVDLQRAQKELALAHEQLPQYARTVQTVGALLAILNAVVNAFPPDSVPGSKLKQLLTEWTKLQGDVHTAGEKVRQVCQTVGHDVANVLGKIEDDFAPAGKAVQAAMSVGSELAGRIRPWSEKIHHAINNVGALKWLVSMMQWLGNAIDWLLDQISLGTLLQELGDHVMRPILKGLHLDGIAQTIENGLPKNVDDCVQTLKQAPEYIAALKVELAKYKTADGQSPLVPFITDVLKALNGPVAVNNPDIPYWNPPAVSKQLSVDEAVANRLKYVSLVDKRAAVYVACFNATKQLGPAPANRLQSSWNPAATLQSSGNSATTLPWPGNPAARTARKIKAGAASFPKEETLTDEWKPVTVLRDAVDKATATVAPGAHHIADLERNLAAFDAQSALAPLLAEDMADISQIWQDVQDIATKVKSVAGGTILAQVLDGFAKGLASSVSAAGALANEAKRFKTNADRLDGLIKQADTALRQRFANASSHEGSSYVEALTTRYATWKMHTNTLPRAVAMLSAADKNAAHAKDIAAIRDQANETARGLVGTINNSTAANTQIQQAITDLIDELERYGNGASAMAGPIDAVRAHQHHLHKIDHCLNFADAILDPLSWLLATYACKGNTKIAPIQAVVKVMQSSGKGHLAQWLDTGVQAAVVALTDAELHIGHATSSLAMLNAALERDGFVRATKAVQDITALLAGLDKDLALKDADTKTDWLDSATESKLASLATAIAGN